MRLGYERVSTDQQTTEGQHFRLVEAGVDRIFTDEAMSGRKASRPELDKMLDMLSSAKCWCGVYAIAECTDCAASLCGDHIRRPAGLVICQADLSRQG